jgi:hypothetical protein
MAFAICTYWDWCEALHVGYRCRAMNPGNASRAPPDQRCCHHIPLEASLRVLSSA